jgi:hypothetical protein
VKTVRETPTDVRVAPVPAGSVSEWSAPALRPVAHWVLMPAADGRSRLEMVWETPNPMPPRRTAV